MQVKSLGEGCGSLHSLSVKIFDSSYCVIKNNIKIKTIMGGFCFLAGTVIECPYLMKNFEKEKRKKKKVHYPAGGKMRCNIFLKKIWTYFNSRRDFFQKTRKGLILSWHFPDGITLLSFFVFFLIRVVGRDVAAL